MTIGSRVVLIRGGGDLASGVALRLHRSGFCVVITELARPLAVRRWVSFSEAVLQGEAVVEGVKAVLAASMVEMEQALTSGKIPVVVDPTGEWIPKLNPRVVIDARMRKLPPEARIENTSFVIGLGPGFEAGKDCHAVIETQRGHFLGRIFWQGKAAADSGVPDVVADKKTERVLRSPADGELHVFAAIGDPVKEGQLVARVNGQSVNAIFSGVIRGMLYNGLVVTRGMKIGDIDPRNDPSYCALVSDKSLAIGGAILEAMLSQGIFPDKAFQK